MALDMTPEQKDQGKTNFNQATAGLAQAEANSQKTGPDRRSFMKSVLWTGAAAVPVSAASYFGYQRLQGDGKPVLAALIGGGDEGGVLVGEHNPDFLKFVSVCDIRPSNMKRIFDGDPRALALRKGFRKIYGKDADKIDKFTDYDSFIRNLRENKDIEAVVIALPLNWHAKAAIDVMKVGKDRGKPIHVLCEKLMAWNISQCKKMIAVAKETGSILSIGHQRHYSMLYAQSVELIRSGVLGDIRHIRALWHRNNSWPYDGDPKNEVAGTQPYYRDGWYPPVLTEDFDALKESIKSTTLIASNNWSVGASITSPAVALWPSLVATNWTPVVFSWGRSIRSPSRALVPNRSTAKIVMTAIVRTMSSSPTNFLVQTMARIKMISLW